MRPKFRDICYMVEGKKRQPGNWPDRGANPGPLRERQLCYPLTTAVVTLMLDLVLSKLDIRRDAGSNYHDVDRFLCPNA